MLEEPSVSTPWNAVLMPWLAVHAVPNHRKAGPTFAALT
jgi:hypothetical protein